MSELNEKTPGRVKEIPSQMQVLIENIERLEMNTQNLNQLFALQHGADERPERASGNCQLGEMLMALNDRLEVINNSLSTAEI